MWLSIMDTSRRYFSYRLACDLLPGIVSLLRRAIKAKATRTKAQEDLKAYKQRLVLAGGAYPNRNRISAYVDLAQTSHESMKQCVDSILDQGVEVKDLDRGLIDFPALYQGQPVYLCFHLGEDTITHWHGFEEGFAGRKRISQDFIDQLDAGFSS